MWQKGFEGMNMAGKTDLRPAVIEDRPYLYQSMACSDVTPAMMGLPRFPDHPVPDYPTFCEDLMTRPLPMRAALARSSSPQPVVTSALPATPYAAGLPNSNLDAARKDWGQGHGVRPLEQRAHHCRLSQGRLCSLR